MAVYIWEGQTSKGESRNGKMEGQSEEEVRAKLASQNITPTKIRPKGLLDMEFDLSALGTVKLKEKMIFTRQLATMIDAGLPIIQALDLLQSQEPNPKFKSIINDVKMAVETGSNFADALGKHPKVFDRLYVNLVEAGEAGGMLDSILNRLAVYMEKNAKLVAKVKGALTYPIVTLVIATLVVLVLLWKVIPTFESMFANFGNAALPGPTRFVIDLSHSLSDNIVPIFLGFAGFGLLMRYLLKTPKTRRIIDKILLKTPAIGPVIRKAAVARFTRTMGTMVSSGVPILQALEIVARSSGNYIIEEALLYVREKISEGQNLVGPLMETGIFPSMVVQMIGVGEATGALDTMLNKIADFYEEEVDEAVEGLTSMIEPLMMVVVGGIIAGLMLAMYLPIFSLANTVGH